MIPMSDAPSLGNRNSQHSFSQIPNVNTTRSMFDRSFAVKDTFDFDELVPFFCDEILPGDTVNLNVNTFARLATQVIPFMDNAYLDYFFFFVPNRLLWVNWEKFNGAQDNPADSIAFVIPTVTINTGSGVAVGTIFDHFGLPTEIDDYSFNSLPLRAYNLIWKEWFRDQNLQNSPIINTDDGPDLVTDYATLKRCKRPDYFTSCLPTPQKGTAVSLPLGTVAPVVTNSLQPTVSELTGSEWGPNVGLSSDNSAFIFRGGTAGTGNDAIKWGNQTGMQADLSTATAATLDQFRLAILTQSLLELNMRGGTRYVEIIRAHWNVQSPDYRLQRPEFLSGASTKINQHPVPNTSGTATEDQAQLASYATSSSDGSRIGFSKSFTEHGYVIGLVQARADVTYQHGLHRMWSRSTRFDFFWPKLQELGEQSVLNKEIYLQGAAGGAADTSVFGYQERYAEYRYKPSEIRGQFRSTFATSLEAEHMAEEFVALPVLNSTFIQSSTPIERNLAVAAAYPHIRLDAWFNYRHARVMMTYGVPATLGRF